MNSLRSGFVSADLAEQFGDQCALLNVDNETSWTYSELHHQTFRWVNIFRNQQLKSGDVVVWLAKNRMDFFALLFAAKECGVVVLPLNWRESSRVQRDIVALAQPKLILFESAFQTEANRLQTFTGVNTLDIDALALFESPPSTLINEVTPDEYAPWYLLFTSGTTGKPKAVIYTWAMHKANVENANHFYEFSQSDTTVSVLPHYHTAGINLFALPTLMAGGRVLVFQNADPKQLLSELQARSVTTLLLVPTLLQKMADQSEFESFSHDDTQIKLIASGGAPLPVSLWQLWGNKGFLIQNGCGLTESGPTLFLQTKREADAQPTAIGQPAPNVQVRLIALDGEEAHADEPGEIWIKGPSITPGYWRDSSANNAAFRDGWFRTGDVAKQTNGQYVLVDRMSDMFICGGENVYPAEVEEILLNYQGVEEAVVLGETHRIWGETGVGFVVAKPGYLLSEKQILTFCKTHLARYKVPKRIQFVDELPKTATGKIRRGIVNTWVKH